MFDAIAVGAAVETATFLFLLCACIAIEHIGPREHFPLAARIPGIIMNTAGSGLSIMIMWPLGVLWAKTGLAATITLPLWQWLQPLGTLGYALQFLFLVCLADFLAYWRHRAEHAWFWPIHAVHHSPRELHAANDIGHPLQTIISIAFVSIPMSLVQVSGPDVPFGIGALVIMLSIYIHSPIQLHFGPLRRVLVDNRYHRVHHSIEPRHFDRNFGICFSMWDYMFGTAYDPKEEWPSVGLVETPAPRTLTEYLMLPVQICRRSSIWDPAEISHESAAREEDTTKDASFTAFRSADT